MKVRNLFGGPEFEVVEGLVVKDQQGILHTVEKAAFEEVHAKQQWQDVTGGCVTDKIEHGQLIRHGGRILAFMPYDYRLRKVQFDLPREYKDGCFQPVKQVWAFIVECEEP